MQRRRLGSRNVRNAGTAREVVRNAGTAREVVRNVGTGTFAKSIEHRNVRRAATFAKTAYMLAKGRHAIEGTC